MIPKQKENYTGPTGEPYVKGPTVNPPTLEELKELQKTIAVQEKKDLTKNHLNNESILYLISTFVIILVIVVLIKKIKK